MSVFNFESMSPFKDDDLTGVAIGIIATYADENVERRPLAKEFLLSVDANTVTVESMRSDGVMIYAILEFDGESFSLIAQGEGIPMKPEGWYPNQ